MVYISTLAPLLPVLKQHIHTHAQVHVCTHTHTMPAYVASIKFALGLEEPGPVGLHCRV